MRETMPSPPEPLDEHRPLLFAIAYRMLGTVSDAEDMVQETYLRWRRALDTGAAIAAPKGWLTTTITHLCIDQLRSARARREEYIGPWLPEPIVTGPAADPAEGVALAESLSLAFLTVLERLNPVERAIFLLHDVFGYEFAEIAPIVEREAANCRQIARRARASIQRARPRIPLQPGERERLTSEFLRACTQGDLPALVATLADDIAVWSDGGGRVQAARKPVRGAEKAARFLLHIVADGAAQGVTFVATTVNGQPGVLIATPDGPYGVVALDIAAGRIREIDIVINPDKLRHLAPPA
jgi:RNA polymerase sigma-70 factor (ECF subfamily)